MVRERREHRGEVRWQDNGSRHIGVHSDPERGAGEHQIAMAMGVQISNEEEQPEQDEENSPYLLGRDPAVEEVRRRKS
jgi:hypothetical protein